MRFLRSASAPRRRRREGAAAVEFAMVAFPFFLMIFAVMEIGLIFIVDTALENATLQASRLIRTGQAAGGTITASAFKQKLCDNMSIFAGDCVSRAYVDVRTIPQFRNTTLPNPIVNGDMNEASLQYVTGSPGSLVLIRVFYKQPLITPMMSQVLKKLNSGEAILTVTTAFRNEPYAN